MNDSLQRHHRAATAAGAFALVFAVTACQSVQSPAPSEPTAEPVIAFDADALASTFQQAAEDMRVPGAMLVVRTPQGELVESYGATELDGDRAPSLDDHIRIGSVTKTMVGTVILQLVQEGKLGLDDPISDYRPDVPGGEEITIEQLLSMRSGLYNYVLDLELSRTMDEAPQTAWEPEELVAIGLGHPVSFAPGAQWEYSNTNTALLGLVAEKLEGRPLAEILTERLFEPLGMDDTSFPAITDGTMPEPFARGYAFGTNVETVESNELSQTVQDGWLAGTLKPMDQTDLNPSWGWAAGAGISTAADLMLWGEALTDGSLLDPEHQAHRLTNLGATSDQPAAPLYGNAIATFGSLYGHTGELPGYNTFVGSDPENEVVLVLWANLAPLPDGRDPAATMAKILIEQLYPQGE
ncbi:MAG TPA: serine hydrolase domain-containing protein [Microbacterium sp.]|nr:serine hydrolase domain-containing protein [Microbacterium sp.]